MLKPIPRLILIAAVVGGGIFGVNKYFADSGGLKGMVTRAMVPSSIDVPTAGTAGQGPTALPASNIKIAPAHSDYTARVLVLPWNADAALHYANGDAVTTPGSMMAAHGVHIALERQDDYSQMVAEQAVFAGEIAKGVANPTKGAAFVVIMGDGGPGYFASAKDSFAKLGQQLEVVGSFGYSRGEDKCMLPAAVAGDPQKARGSLIGAVLRDGDWNICMK